jgi:hypothetical protein
MFIDRSDDPRIPGGGGATAEVDHLAEIARLDVEIAKRQGLQMAHMAAHVADVERAAAEEAAGAEPYWTSADTSPAPSAFAEINLALHASGPHADGRIAAACALAADLPRTLAALCAGRLTLSRAMVIQDQLFHLDGAERAGAELDALFEAPTLTPANLRRKLARIVARINPDAVVKRRKAERKKRHVAVQPVADGMAYLTAYLSAEDANAIFGLADTVAHAAKTPGDERTIDERRADGLVDLLLRPDGEERVTYEAQVLVPVGTVLGVNGEPGYLPGYGPAPPTSAKSSPPTRPGGASSPTRSPTPPWMSRPTATSPAPGSPGSFTSETRPAAGPAAPAPASRPTTPSAANTAAPPSLATSATSAPTTTK